MKHFADVVLNSGGTPVKSALVSVFLAGTQTPASIFSDDGITATSNPVVTDASGRFDFYVADGRYDLSVSGVNITTYLLKDIEIFDATEKATGDTAATFTVLSAKNFAGVRYADQFTGADIGAKINAAITDLGATGGIVYVPKGAYSYSTTIAADGTRDITICGAGGQTAGGTAATALTYTGTGIAVSATSTTAFHLTSLQLVWNNAGLVGPIVELTHGAAGGNFDSSWAEIDHCSFFGSGVNAPVIISLDKVINSTVHHNTFQNYQVAIRGAVDGTGYTNSTQITHNNFSSSTGTAVTAHITNLATGCAVRDNTFEMGQAIGTPAVLAYTATPVGGTVGIEFSNNWIGDNSANGTYTMFTLGIGATVGGWSFTGNYINGGGSNTTLFSIPNSYTGGSIRGNVIATAGTAFAFGTGVTNFEATGNKVSGVTTLFTGTPGAGCILEDSTGNYIIANGTVLKNNADANLTYAIGAGSSADQFIKLQLVDKSGVQQGAFVKDATNHISLQDSAGTGRISWATGSSNTFISGGAGGTSIFLCGAGLMALGNATGLLTVYNNISTAGNGLASIFGATSQRTESAADTNVLTFTPPAAVGSYRIRFVMSVSAANAATLGWTATWTDSNGNAQTPTNLALFQTGVAAPALTFTTSAAGNYHGYVDIDTNNAATNIVVKLTFSGTSFTAKVSATIERLI